jgi:hypothetical protein
MASRQAFTEPKNSAIISINQSWPHADSRQPHRSCRAEQFQRGRLALNSSERAPNNRATTHHKTLLPS